MHDDTPSRFSPLRYTRGYHDYLICGIGTELETIGDNPTHRYEKICSYHVVHLRPANGRLHPRCDMVEFTDERPIDSLIRHFDVGQRTLVVCNNSLVLLGSSDLVDLLEDGTLSIAKGRTDAADLGRDDGTEVSTEQFIASAPPTIVTLERSNPHACYTIVDIANYGIRDMEDIYRKLSQKERDTLSRLGWGTIPTVDSLRFTALLARAMQEYYNVCKRFRFGETATSYAGQGMRAYRLRPEGTRIQTHSHKPAAELERLSYGLGRGEAFYHGYYQGDCYLLDINSLYPHLGETQLFPVSLQDYQESCRLSTIEEWCQDSAVILQGRIETDEPIYRAVDGNKVVYPVGRFNATLSGPECLQCIRRGHLVKVYRACRYRQDSILREYASHCLRARQLCQTEGNEIATYFVKLITNGLWGKFAQLGMRWVVRPEIASPLRYGGFTELNRETGEMSYYRVINGIVSRLESVHFTDNTFPAISSVINGMSRGLLWDLITAAGRETVLYAAIDGLIVSTKGKSRLESLGHISKTEPGKLRIAEHADHCYIQSYGVYSIGRKTAYVGMPRSNRHRTIGFWNQKASSVLDGNGKAYRVTATRLAATPIEARANLSKRSDKPGYFKDVPSLYQDRLAPRDWRQPDTQPSFQWPAYAR